MEPFENVNIFEHTEASYSYRYRNISLATRCYGSVAMVTGASPHLCATMEFSKIVNSGFNHSAFWAVFDSLPITTMVIIVSSPPHSCTCRCPSAYARAIPSPLVFDSSTCAVGSEYRAFDNGLCGTFVHHSDVLLRQPPFYSCRCPPPSYNQLSRPQPRLLPPW